MDPRTSAKVTAPDLLKAFHESAPVQDVVLDADLRVFLMLVDGDDVVRVEERPMSELETVIQLLRMHLQSGGQREGYIAVALEAPQLYREVSKALSAPTD